VRPAFRRCGHATEILRQSVAIARAGGVERILVVCDDDNVGSARVIERCGGVLESVVTPHDGGRQIRRHRMN
jgi:predicted acetyltransferase